MTPRRNLFNHRLKALLLLLGVLIVVALTYGARLRQELLAWLLLKSQAPAESAVEELVESYRDPVPFVVRLWNTGKVAHRHLALAAVRGRSLHAHALDPRLEPLLRAGALDPDASVREISLGILAQQHSPQLISAAREQLTSLDPQVRLLGVQYLARIEPAQGLPALVPLLDDLDLRVVTAVDAAFRRWTGIDDGVRVAQSIPKKRATGEESLDPGDVAAIQVAIAHRKAWWHLHQSEYASISQTARESVTGPLENSPVADFSLRDLSGKKVQLSQFRGKLIVLNFWATWCSACLREIPDLVELQKRHAPELVVLGISLDGVPDEHGHTGSHEESSADVAPGQDENAAPPDEKAAAPIDRIRAKVAGIAQTRGITYPVLLDPGNQVGSRFNGGELPTNVLIDRAGTVRRRFIGARPLAAWEAMIAELSPR